MDLREWRIRHGIKQKAVASHLGVSRGTYAEYEKHQDRMTVGKAVMACSFMHAPVDEIFLPCDVTSDDVS